MTGQRIDFEKLNNARDLGGMPAADGRKIKLHKLIRSGHLVGMTEPDMNILSGMVGHIVDFRTETETREKPDPEIPGIEYHRMPIFDELTAGITREESADASLKKLIFDPKGARQYMINTYLGFVTGKKAIQEYAKFFDLLSIPHEKAVLWHCTAGKDRAGFAAVLVQKILGVNDADIMEDYLYTNECLETETAMLTEMIAKQAGKDTPEMREAIGYLFGAKEEYLMALYKKAEEIYGGLDGYIETGLGMDGMKREQLRDIYLTP